MKNEFFFNESTRMLYYYNNVSGANSDLSNLVFEATKLKVLMNYTWNHEKTLFVINPYNGKDSAVIMIEDVMFSFDLIMNILILIFH